MPQKTIFTAPDFAFGAHQRGLSTYAQAMALCALLDSSPWDHETGRTVGGGTMDYNPTAPTTSDENDQNGIVLEMFFGAQLSATDPATGDVYLPWDIRFTGSPGRLSAGLCLNALALNGAAGKLLALQGFERNLFNGQLP